MIFPTQLRELALAQPTQPGGPAILHAASGLALVGDRFYVVADDGLELVSFPLVGAEPGHIHRLLPGELPLDKKERKKLKPDFEALCLLPPGPAFPHGALLALPSGSKPNRARGALVPLQPAGAPGTPREIDFGPLYSELQKTFTDLNIEGAACLGPRLRLFQRGNSVLRQNGWLDLDLTAALTELATDSALSPRPLQKTVAAEVGDINGIPLTFTDATAFAGDRILFIAAAEATEDTYEDGDFLGAVAGLMTAEGEIGETVLLGVSQKPEGIAWAPALGDREFLLVTDADDSSEPSLLYRGRLEA